VRHRDTDTQPEPEWQLQIQIQVGLVSPSPRHVPLRKTCSLGRVLSACVPLSLSIRNYSNKKIVTSSSSRPYTPENKNDNKKKKEKNSHLKSKLVLVTAVGISWFLVVFSFLVWPHKCTSTMATLGLSKVFILDKYFTELQKFWETEKKLQGKLKSKGF